jgi:hypothetical protein
MRLSHSTRTSHTVSATLVEGPHGCSRCTPGWQGDRLRLLFRLQPRLRLLLGLFIRVRLRVRPYRVRVRDQHRRGTTVRPRYRLGHNIISRRKIRLLARLQARRPNRQQLTLRRLPRLTPLPGGNPASSNRGAYVNRGGDYRL